MLPLEPILDFTVLLAEDDDDSREMLAAILHRHGAKTLLAANGLEAVPHLLHDAPDLVLTDIFMPGADGFEVLRATREILGDTPCIAISAGTVGDDRRRSLRAGFDEYFTKPVDYRILLDALRAAHAAHESGVPRGSTS